MQRRTQRSSNRPTTTEQGYGWRWQQARIPHLQRNPLCAECLRQARIEPATVVDHIIPHKGDQALFWNTSNWQSLCKPCHDLKTIKEDGGLDSGFHTHPEWLPIPACPVVLVTGPPGAGKTTYCQKQATPVDVVIDLDDCFALICGVHGHHADKQYLKQAMRLRNKQIAQLATKQKGKAYLIVTSPTKPECSWWIRKLKASHILLDPGIDTCLQRVPTGRRRQEVVNWYTKAKANTWSAPSTRVRRRIGIDGWPV